MNRFAARSSHVAIFAVLVWTAAVAGPADLVVEPTGDGRVSLRVGAESPFHTTGNAVEEPRLIRVEASGDRAAVWVEATADGRRIPHYALGLDGAPLGEAVATSYRLMLRHGEFDPQAGAPPVESGLAASGTERLYVVQFPTPPLESYRGRIESLGGAVRGFLPGHAHIVEMPDEVRSRVAALPFVRWIGPYHPAYRLERVLRAPLDELSERYPSQRYSLLTFEGGDALEQVVARLAGLGGDVDAERAGKTLANATLTPEQLMDVVRWDEIAFIDRWGPLERDMDIVRSQGGADYLESVAGYTGVGVRGESFDTGFDLDHPDFTSRPPIEHGGPVGLDSHGTACLGICFGDGTGDPQARGLMPDGQGIVADYNNIGLSGSTRYDHTGELLDPPYEAVFQTASVGSPRTTQYTTISADHDALLFDWQVLHCQSQSNAGNQNSRPQAWAKNVVSGGAFNHYDTEDTSDDCWCNTGSIGPASDGRIKPDLSFFYDDTYTTYTTSGGYGQFGGTSGATPSICGHFGLFFQMWSDGIFGNEVDPAGTVFSNRPKMTTAKAFMINTAEPYPFSGQSADMTRVHQGWGVPSVRNVYDQRDNVSFIDESVLLTHTDAVEFNAFVDPGEPAIKVTMTYADPPGNPAASQHRVNDLSLKVTSPSGEVYHGNVGLLDGNWSQAGGAPNDYDTVENVFVQNPEDGLWILEVSAPEIVQDGHVETPELDADFALVVTGALVTKCTSDGKVSLAGSAFACEDDAGLRVVDCDLNADDNAIETVEVTVDSTSEPGGETVTLTETGAATGTFTGSIPVSETDAPGTLLVTGGDVVTATYVDADDGQGGTNLTKTDEATIDCSGPGITGVDEQDVTGSSARIVWTTDEPATSEVVWGPTIPPSNHESSDWRVTDHALSLDGLQECTVYHYEVRSRDALANEAVDDNGGAYHYFETLGDFGNGLQPCHAGQLTVAEATANCSDTIRAEVVDLDLNTDPEVADTVVLTATSTTETDPETLIATETGPNTSVFVGTIDTASGAPVPDGLLQTSHGDVITVTYRDADDGSGRPAVSFDTATADCAGPEISNLRVESITDRRATVRWTTAEPADTRVEWGATPALGNVESSSDLTTDHAVTIHRFQDCSPFYFTVRSTDAYGNVREGHNAGEPFHFQTWEIPGLYYRIDFENGAEGWTLEGEWEVGAPQALGGSSGNADPAEAYNNDGVLGHDLSGLGAHPGDYEPGVAENARSPVLDATTWTDTELIYHRRLNAGSNDSASAWVYSDGAGRPIYTSQGDPTFESGYQVVTVPLASYGVDGAASVQLEFRQFADGSGQYSGWNVDDVILKDGTLPDYGACQDCGVAPSFEGAASAIDDDACGATGVTVSWNDAVSWGSGGGGTFAVYRGEAPDFVPSAANRIAAGVSGTSYHDAAAPTDRTLYYVVRAESDESCGTGPANGGLLDANEVRMPVSETTSIPAPDAVTGMRGELVNHAHVRMTWNTVAYAASYRIYRSSAPDGGFEMVAETAEPEWTDLDEGGTVDTFYYRVVGVNACGVEGP